MEGILSMMDVVVLNYALHYNPENGQTFVRSLRLRLLRRKRQKASSCVPASQSLLTAVETVLRHTRRLPAGANAGVL